MRIFLFFILTSLVYSQVFNKDSEQINSTRHIQNIKFASTTSTVFTFDNISKNKKIALTTFFISSNKNLNFNSSSVLMGSIKISWNLNLTGRMSANSYQKRAINIYGWGLSYKPGKEEKFSPWNFGVNSAIYRSYNNVRFSSLNLSIIRKILWRNIDLFLGVSSSNVKGIDYQFEKNLGSQNFEYNHSNLIMGTTINFVGINILTKYYYNVDNYAILIGLQKEF